MIEFRDVYVKYKDTGIEALHGINLTIKDGEFVCVYGAPSSGKTTIRNLIYREIRPSQGRVLIDGFCISNMSRSLVPMLRRHLGLIIDDFMLLENKSVRDNLMLAAEATGGSKGRLDIKALSLLMDINPSIKMSNCVSWLSGCDTKEVEITKALINDPSIIVADEPTCHLGPYSSERIRNTLHRISRRGISVLFLTADEWEVDNRYDHVIKLENGYIVEDTIFTFYSLVQDSSAYSSSGYHL